MFYRRIAYLVNATHFRIKSQSMRVKSTLSCRDHRRCAGYRTRIYACFSKIPWILFFFHPLDPERREMKYICMRRRRRGRFNFRLKISRNSNLIARTTIFFLIIYGERKKERERVARRSPINRDHLQRAKEVGGAIVRREGLPSSHIEVPRDCRWIREITGFLGIRTRLLPQYPRDGYWSCEASSPPLIGLTVSAVYTVPLCWFCLCEASALSLSRSFSVSWSSPHLSEIQKYFKN